MERYVYEFKVQGPKEKWVKLFLSSDDVEHLTLESLIERVVTRFSMDPRNALSFFYLDGDDWIELIAGDLDSFVDMIESATNTGVNKKRITLKCDFTHTSPIHVVASSQAQKRVRCSPSPSPQAKGGKTVTIRQARKKPKTLAPLFDNTCNQNQSSYVSPTQKFFDKLSKDVEEQRKVVVVKENELSDLEASFKPLSRQQRPLCTNCHQPGHNRAICSFTPCVSATLCRDIRRHHDEEKYYKSLQSQVKAEKGKLKKLEDDQNSKQESFKSSTNTFASLIQTDLINSNPSKYLRSSVQGNKIPNWLLVQTDIRKLERICNGNVPEKSEIRRLLEQYDEEFAILKSKQDNGSRQKSKQHCNPVKKLWEQKGIKFPGKGVLPNSKGTLLHDQPKSEDEEQYFLELGIKESLKSPSATYTGNNLKSSSTCTSTATKDTNAETLAQPEDADYGLSLLFSAAQFLENP